MNAKFLLPPVMRKDHIHYTAPEARHTNVKENAKQIGKDIGSHIKKNYNPNDPLFTKDTVEGHSLNNLWSGYKLGGKGKLAVTGSLLAGGSIMVANPRGVQAAYNNRQNVQYESEAQDVESLQSTRADGLGYQAQVGTNPGLNASGDLVFAMHKTRHSGQF
jgi:hypothetical protein